MYHNILHHSRNNILSYGFAMGNSINHTTKHINNALEHSIKNNIHINFLAIFTYLLLTNNLCCLYCKNVNILEHYNFNIFQSLS